MNELHYAQWAAENYGPTVALALVVIIGQAYAIKKLYEVSREDHRTMREMLHERNTLVNSVFAQLLERRRDS